METLELRSGKKYTKKHLRTSTGSRCEDEEFAEQLEADGVDLEIIDGASDFFFFFLMEPCRLILWIWQDMTGKDSLQGGAKFSTGGEMEWRKSY